MLSTNYDTGQTETPEGDTYIPVPCNNRPKSRHTILIALQKESILPLGLFQSSAISEFYGGPLKVSAYLFECIYKISRPRQLASIEPKHWFYPEAVCCF